MTDADCVIAISHVKRPAGRWLDCETVLRLQTGDVGPMLPMCRRELPTLIKSERFNFSVLSEDELKTLHVFKPFFG